MQYVPEVKHSQYNLMHLLFLHLHLFFVVAVVVADVVVDDDAADDDDDDDFCIDDDDDVDVFVVFDVIDNGKCGGCGGGPAWNDCVFTVVVDKLVLSNVFSFENVWKDIVVVVVVAAGAGAGVTVGTWSLDSSFTTLSGG